MEQQLRAEVRGAAAEQLRSAAELHEAREAMQRSQAEAEALRLRAQAAQREAEDARQVPAPATCLFPDVGLWVVLSCQ